VFYVQWAFSRPHAFRSDRLAERPVGCGPGADVADKPLHPLGCVYVQALPDDGRAAAARALPPVGLHPPHAAAQELPLELRSVVLLGIDRLGCLSSTGRVYRAGGRGCLSTSRQVEEISLLSPVYLPMRWIGASPAAVCARRFLAQSGHRAEIPSFLCVSEQNGRSKGIELLRIPGRSRTGDQRTEACTEALTKAGNR
jgi:hypothetical protein